MGLISSAHFKPITNIFCVHIIKRYKVILRGIEAKAKSRSHHGLPGVLENERQIGFNLKERDNVLFCPLPCIWKNCHMARPGYRKIMVYGNRFPRIECENQKERHQTSGKGLSNIQRCRSKARFVKTASASPC